MKTLVTGATGTIGSQVARTLLQRGVDVRVGLRDPAKGDALAKAGAEVVRLDFDDPSSLTAAFAGVDRLFLLTPFVETFLPQVEAAVAAASDADVSFILRLSALGADPKSDDGLSGQHGKAEEVVKDSGADWAVVRPTFFADNVLKYQGGAVAQGAFYGASHGGKVAYVSSRDIAEASAAILTDPTAHASKTYTLTGPTPVTDEEVAAQLSAISGRAIAYVDLSAEQLLQGQIDAGTPPWMAEHLVTLEGVKSAGWAANPTDDLPKLLGREPEAPAAFLQRHATQLRLARAGATACDTPC